MADLNITLVSGEVMERYAGMLLSNQEGGMDHSLIPALLSRVRLMVRKYYDDFTTRMILKACVLVACVIDGVVRFTLKCVIDPVLRITSACCNSNSACCKNKHPPVCRKTLRNPAGNMAAQLSAVTHSVTAASCYV